MLRWPLAFCSSLLVGQLALAEDMAVPPPTTPAVAVDYKAQIKEIENKQKPIKEAALKDNPEISKLKNDSEESKKRYDSAADAKLKDNPEYQALKAQINELKAQQKKEKEHKEGKEGKEGKDKQKGK